MQKTKQQILEEAGYTPERGRPKKSNGKPAVVSFALDEPWLSLLDDLAKSGNLSRNIVARDLIIDRLKQTLPNYPKPL